ncbi:surface carbohydrate biosynthesis protein [Paenibacillus sp. HJGM_3]|uniref:surface carbohydrate biosynthesis protein n=1 Tax=Paenibacillus sp. HJGM_3 TaxID=3379816 RepID=UPI003859F580
MNNTKIMLVYEHRRREIDYLVFLKIKLEDAGFQCRIASISYSFMKTLTAFVPDLLFMPWGYDTRFIQAARKVNPNIIVIDSHAEQIMDKTTLYDVLRNNTIKVSDYHLSWGEKFKNDYLDGVEEFSYIVGNSRMDLYKKPYNQIYSSDIKSKYGLECKKVILFPMSFNIVYYKTHEMETLEKEMPNIYKERDENIDQLTQITSYITQYIENNKNDDYVFVLRPHPAEPLEEVQKRFPKLDQLKIIYGDGIQGWILQSDVIFAWTSTTIMDAFMNNKPCWLVDAVDTRYSKLSHFAYAKSIKTYDQFENALNLCLNHNYDETAYWHVDEFNSFIEDNFGPNDGMSFERTAEAIKNMVSKEARRLADHTDFPQQIINKEKCKERIKTILAELNILNRVSRWNKLQEEYISKRALVEMEQKYKRYLREPLYAK